MPPDRNGSPTTWKSPVRNQPGVVRQSLFAAHLHEDQTVSFVPDILLLVPAIFRPNFDTRFLLSFKTVSNCATVNLSWGLPASRLSQGPATSVGTP